jgi:hypothetical protein
MILSQKGQVSTFISIRKAVFVFGGKNENKNTNLKKNWTVGDAKKTHHTRVRNKADRCIPRVCSVPGANLELTSQYQQDYILIRERKVKLGTPNLHWQPGWEGCHNRPKS